jgi:SAM-dependent methyltransferase
MMSETEKTWKVKCLLCGSESHVRSVGENTVFGEPLTECFCESCGLYFLGTQPSEARLEEYYSREYYSAPEKSGIIYMFRSRFSRMRAWSQYLYMSHIMDNEGSLPERKALEVGSSDGSLLVIFRKHGWKIRGLEFSDFSVRKAREVHRIKLEKKSILDLDPADEKFDLIALSHVLEHMTEPIQTLDHCRMLLMQGGRIFVELPFAPLERECTAEELGLYLNTTHLYDFRPEALTSLTGMAGLKTVSLERYFYRIPGFLRKHSAAIGKALMIGALPLSKPVELGAVLLAAIFMNMKYAMKSDPMMRIAPGSPWQGFGDVLRIMLKKEE